MKVLLSFAFYASLRYFLYLLLSLFCCLMLASSSAIEVSVASAGFGLCPLSKLEPDLGETLLVASED